MIKIESKSAGRVSVRETVIMGIHAVVISRVSRVGSKVTLVGMTAAGHPHRRTYGAFDQVLVRVPVADFGKGIL
jgi:hypothetical protein